jgi:molecular chaperone DnaK
MTYGNKLLGNFQLVGIPPAPARVPQIEVTFDIDANGIVNVSARDRGTGKEQSMTITGGGSLPREDIDRMVREAEEYAEEDRRRREAAEAKNQAESLVYSTEKSLTDYGDKITEEDRSTVQAALTELKEKLTGDDSVAIRSATEKLQQASYKLAEAVYSSQQAQQSPDGDAGQPGPAASAGSEAGAGTGQGPDDVVDAEIIDDDQQQKGA